MFAETFFDCAKIFVKNLLDQGGKNWENFVESFFYQVNFFVENFLGSGKFPWHKKFLDHGKVMTVEKFFDCEKIPWLWKSLLIVEKSLDCGKFPRLWKSWLIVEKFLDCGKLTFLTAGKIICLIILETNADAEIIKTYILNLQQKLSSFTFFYGRQSQYYVQ